MADESDEASGGTLWVWGAAAIAMGGGVALGLGTARSEWGPLVRRLFHYGGAFACVLTGLAMLFPLAAFGPKTQKARQVRVRMAAVGVSQIVLGFVQLIPSGPVQYILTGAACLLVVAALLGVPKRWFASSASSPA